MPDGQRLDGLARPMVPPVTDVPYVNRETTCPVRVGETTHSAGVTLRAELAGYQDNDDRQRLAFFVSGAHLCLGRVLTLDLWREIGHGLARIPLVARAEAYGLRRDDVFHMPGTFTLELATP